MKSKLFQKLIAGIQIGVLLLLLLSVHAFAEGEDPSSDTPSLPPMEEIELSASDSYSFVDSYSQEALLAEATAFPEAYDMREQGYITSVKLQNPFGSCWAFAAIAAAESSILSSGLAAEDGLDATTLNLSERHLSIFTSTPVRDKSSSQYGEGFKEEGISASQKLQRGGYSFLASNVFASGAGPVLEADDPDLIYQGRNGIIDYRYFEGALQAYCFSADDDWDIPYEKRNTKSYTLKESYVLPTPAEIIIEDVTKGVDYWEYSYNEAATAAIKKQLLAGRAVEIGFQADQASPNQDEVEPLMLSDQWAHYGTYMGFANHAVTIVGWDDRYPKENFLEGNQPPENGAWLVKNSWGSGEEEFPNKAAGNWGLLQGQDKYPYEATSDIHTGYFWLSYYDRSLSLPEAVEFEQTDEDMIMDAYDYMGAHSLNATEYEEESKMANMFRASFSEKVMQIAFQTTHPNTTVKWQVYLLEGDEDDPDGGILKAEGEETYEFGGFHKVDLGEDAFPVACGQYYSIVITEMLADGRYTVNIPIQDIQTHTGIINRSESRVFLDGYWQDMVDEDLQQTLAMDPEEPEALPGENTQRAVDNFSIKGYAIPLDSNLSFAISGTTLLKFVSKHDSATVKLQVVNYGTPESMPDTGKWTIKWRLADEVNMNGFQKDLVTITPSEDGFSAKIAARKTDGECLEGSSLLCADVYSEDGEYLGTALADITVYSVFMEYLEFKDRTKEYYYTGSAILPEVNAYTSGSPGILLQEGVDYTLAYEDNIQCGVAKITATAIGDIDEGEEIRYFAIRPAKAEIESLAAGKGSLTVKVKDQYASGLDGYQIQYRAEDDSEWQNVMIDAGTTETVIKGLQSGVKYEVQVTGYIYASDEYDWYFEEGYYYGQTSETMLSDEILSFDEAPGTVEKIDGNWWYTVDGKIDRSYTGFASNENGWWYVENGLVTFQKKDVIKGVANNEAGKEGIEQWWHVYNSKVTKETTIAKNANGWWRIEDGKVNFDYTGVAKNENGWWYLENGKVDFGYTGFGSNENGWWYVENGKVKFDKNDVIKGIANNEAGKAGTEDWWLVRGSKVVKETTIAKNSNGWWRIEDGKVNFDYTGLDKNEYGWWYLKDGKVDFSHTGFESNENGWWYVEKGQITFKKNDVIKGLANNDAEKEGETDWWHVKESKVTKDHTVAKNVNGWWRIEDGKVNFSFNGLAANENGTWYLIDGKVDFTFSGSYNGYRIVDGKVTE